MAYNDYHAHDGTYYSNDIPTNNPHPHISPITNLYSSNDNTQGTTPMTHSDYHANDSSQLTHNALNAGPAARSHNRPDHDSALQAEHSSTRRQPSNRCETSSQMLTATVHTDPSHTRAPNTQDSTSPNTLQACSQTANKRHKAMASNPTGNPLSHTSVFKVHTIPPTDHNATSRTTGTPNLSALPAPYTLSSPTNYSLMPQYDLHLLIRGTTLTYLQSLELQLLHTILCTISPLIVYSILGPLMTHSPSSSPLTSTPQPFRNMLGYYVNLSFSS